MLNDIEEKITDQVKDVEDKNREIGNRVKQFTLVNRYFDNYCRLNKKKFFKDYFLFNLVFSMLLVINISLYFLPENTPMINILKDSWTSWTQLNMFIFQEFLNSWVIRINILIRELDIGDYFNFYPLEGVFFNYYIPNYVINIILSFQVFLLTYYIVIIYQYYTQRQLFNSTLLNMYIPIPFLFHFMKRNKNGFIYVRLLRQQKNKNILSMYSKMVISNLFELDLDGLTSKDKVHIEMKPMKFLFFYDYYKLYYYINEDKSFVEQKKEEILHETIKEDKKNEETISDYLSTDFSTISTDTEVPTETPDLDIDIEKLKNLNL